MGEHINHSSLVKISNYKWNIYTEKELGFSPYSVSDIQCDSKGRLWGAIDYSYSSAMISPAPHFFIFDGKKATTFSWGDNMFAGNRPRITIDHNDYAWCLAWACNLCGVWNGDKWTLFDGSEFGSSPVWIIREDTNHKMWFGTENGVYIR